MRLKETSDAVKRHRKTFHLARRDPEHWEQERETSLSETLREARERAAIAEREAEANKRLLNHNQQQASLVIVYRGGLYAHEAERLTICGGSWRLLNRD